MNAPSSADISLFAGFRLDRRAGVLSRRDESGVFVPLRVGSRALEILSVLVERPGDLISRDDIIEAVWPGTVVEEANLNVQIAALRRILDQGRAAGSCIQTVAGRGYRFVAAVTRSDAGSPSNSAGGARPRPHLSIVVLPFTNLRDDLEQQYFADGITEDVTTDLSRLAHMFVISRNTAFTYNDKPADTKQIGRELGVRYILEGSVRRSGNHVRVNAQLIDAETDAHLWAERFDRNASDLFAVQDEITSRIAIALNLEMIGAEAARPTEHPDALDYILRARAAAQKPVTRDNYSERVRLYERALELDPISVEAQSWLASALASRVLDDMTDSAPTDIALAETLVEKALAASPRSPLAHFAKGQILRQQHRNEEAISEYEMVIAFNRNWPQAYAHLGRSKFNAGLIEDMIPLVEHAIRLSPRDPDIHHWYTRTGLVHLLQLRIDDAIAWFEKARAANPEQSLHHSYLCSAYALKGDIDRAAGELAEARRVSGDDRFTSLTRLKAVVDFGVPSMRALYEATYFAGLRKAGMPE
jgi:adenylate cyclase